MYRISRILLGGLLLLGASGLVSGQATETTANFEGTVRPAYEAVYPYSSKLVEDALKAKLKEEKIKLKKKKGTLRSMGVTYPKLYRSPLDLYFEPKSLSKKGEGEARLTMWVSKGYDNFIGTDQEENISENVLSFLDDFEKYVVYYDLNEKVEAKEKELKKSEKQHKKMTKKTKKFGSKNADMAHSAAVEQDSKARRKLEKKAKKADKKASSAKKGIENAKDDIEDQMEELQDLKEQRKDARDQLRE